MKITNLSLSLGADTLFKEEASVLMAIVRYGLEKLCLDNLDNGTFLFGYAADDTIGKKCAPEGLIKFKKIITFDFGDGPTEDFNYSGENSRISAKYLLSHNLGCYGMVNFMSIHSFDYDIPPTLTIEATRGCFKCVILSDELDYSHMAFLYCGIGQALACIRKEDLALKKSCERIFRDGFLINNRYQDMTIFMKFIEEVRQLFNDCRLQEIVAWRRWYYNRSSSSKLFYRG
jgi:hypothetical protein